MMGLSALLLVAFGSVFAVVWLIGYVPIVKRKPFSKGIWSPKLFIAKYILAPMDVGVTIILVAGGWVGITSALGISAMVFNVLSGIGLSLGVLFVKKFMAPRWIKQFEVEKERHNNTSLI